MKRKLLSLALSFALCLTLLPGAALATDDKADTWDGTADISWYDESESEYHISTAEQLAGLAQLVNADPGTTNFAGKTFCLENDLDLSGHEWISIGTGRGGTQSKYSFCGVFDGQGHVISNLYSHESYIEGAEGADESHNLLRNALFGSVYNGEVKNLGVADAEIWMDLKDDSAAGKGILVDWMGKSKITNCWTSGSIFSGTKIEKNIGGIVGVTVQGCTISGCYSTATLTGNFTNSEGYYTDPQHLPPDTIGGIVGAKFDDNLTVTDCWFGGKIVVNSILAAVGGIVGYADTATVKNCMVVTKDIGRDSVTQEVNTCWVAYAFGGTVENCYWPDDTKAYDPSPLAYVGGQSNEDQGTAVSDFTADAVLAGLQAHTGSGITWVAGIDHPTFDWDSRNIVADYTAVYAAIKAARAVDGTLYANYSDVQDAIDAVEYNKSKADQAQVNAMAQAVEDAVAKLTYRSADYTKVDEAVAKADALNEADYTDFSAVKAALEAVDRTKNITQQAEVDAMAQAIEDAVSGLTRKSTGSDRDDSSSTPSYPVTPDRADNGAVSVSPKNAIQGSTVTVKVTPDSGYVVDEVTVTDNRGNELKLTQKGVGTYTFTMPAGQVTVTAAFAPAAEQSPFRDVSASDYYYDAVKWAAEEGITSGTSADLFSPSAPCTRAQMVTFLWRAAGSPNVGGALTFTDVADSAYYAPAVRWAASVGVTSGTGAGRFSPDDPCTRGQMAAFLYRWQQSPAASGSNPFADVADSDYYYAAVLWAYQKGVTQGVSANAFAPSAPCTRGQMAMFLYQLKG